MNSPDIEALVKELGTKLQFSPWSDKTGEYNYGEVLDLMNGIGGVNGVTPAPNFRSQDVEPLLNQANVLLDRILADRAAFQQAGEKFATLSLDVVRQYRSNQFTDDEVADGRFEIPFDVSHQQFASYSALIAGLELQAKAIGDQLKPQQLPALDDHVFAAAVIQMLAHRPPAGQQVDPEFPLTTPNGIRIDAGTPSGGDTAQNWAFYLASTIATFENSVRVQALKNQLAAIQTQLASTIPLSEGAGAQGSWDYKNRKHMMARLDLEKMLLALKMQMATVEWLLDFRQQMQSIAPRFRQTVIDAHDRLLVVEEGMSLIYNHVDPVRLPAMIVTQSDVNDMIAWARRAATWLAAFTRQTHNYVLPISVKAAAERTVAGSWKAGEGRRQWTFTIPQALFPRQSFIRLRGLAGWAVSGDRDKLWTFDVSLPTNGATWVYERGQRNQNAQATMRCLISNVTSRANRTIPDVTGATTCYNATPIGDWTIALSNAFDSTDPTVPDDIQIDLYLAALLS